MQIWTFSKHQTFKYDFWEKTQYSNMNFWCFLVTPDIKMKMKMNMMKIKVKMSMMMMKKVSHDYGYFVMKDIL